MNAAIAALAAAGLMVLVRNFKLGGWGCRFCGAQSGHTPTCPTRGADR